MSLSKCSILLVDDDPTVLRILQMYLNADEYEVNSAEDGLAAWEQINQRCPDILITDWNMPRMDGLELLRRVQQAKLPHFVYSILLTARNSSEDIATGLEAGSNDYVSKPVSPVELKARLRAAQRIVQLERNLRQLSESDSLTGAMNRRTFHTQLTREWSRAERFESDLSVVVLDVDFFKKVNDEHGHHAGDMVLVAVANLLRECCRPSDYVCRFGGEEFVVLLTQTDEAGAATWADRFRLRLAQTLVFSGEKTLQITASFGVAQKLEDTPDPDKLIDQADQGLLVAKRTGRNRVIRYSQLNDPMLDPFGNAELEDHPLARIPARDVMTTLVMCLNQHDSIMQAVELVLQLRIASVPVVDDDGKLVGIVSEKDIMLLDVGLDGWRKTVGDIMVTNVVAYDEQTPAKEIFEFLCRVSIRRVVVVRGGQPVGIISRDSFLRWFSNWIQANKTIDSFDADTDGGRRPLRSMEATISTLMRQSQYLLDQLQTTESVEDVVPYVVGGATCMQDLVNDLLGHCQQVFQP
ncbi:MAG: diguanylate cyclase [Pirellulales bacterium]|nr:diguanylate cyclase [Pirellulales bacterium]